MAYNQFDYAGEIEPQMRGQWHGFITQEIGIEPITEGKGRGIGHTCPICGGNDRAHFKEKDGRVFLFCRGACGNTNSTWGNNTCHTPENLCMEYGGYDFPTLVSKCADWLGVRAPQRDSSTGARKNLPSLAPNVRRHNSKPSKAQPFDRARKPLDAILGASELKPWHSIVYCQKNALCGSEGEFMAFGNDADGFDLIVPLFIEASGRVVMTGAVQIQGDGKAIKHGSVSGACSTIGSGEQSVFCTDYAVAQRISRKYAMRAFYSPDIGAFKRCSPTHVYVNSSCLYTLDRATAHYKQSVVYILPVMLSHDCVTYEFEFLSYAECQARISAWESELQESAEHKNNKRTSAA